MLHWGCSRRPWGSSRPSPLRGPRGRSCACAAALARHSSVCARPRPAGAAGRGPHRLCALTAPAAPACAVGGVRWAQKPARPLRGSAAPPCALAAPSRAAAAAGGPSGRLPPSHFFRAVAVGSSGATPPPSPRSPVLLRAAKVGGLAPAAFGRRAAAAARPSAPAPPPGFGPGAGLFCFRCGGFGDCAACGRR